MSDHSAVSSPSSNSDPQPPSDESAVDQLIHSEPHHLPLPDYLLRCQNRSIDLTARQDSINWILNVHAHYQFRPVTAFLSVNYFDRFLSSIPLPANGWAFQLLSVACLSLAAKLEEPIVPLPIDIQVFVPRFVFEPKTVQRMELRVMSVLNWRLRSVTPFDYLNYFISKLGLSGSSLPDPYDLVMSASSDFILNTTRVIDFLGFAPSVIAAAAVISAAGDDVDITESFYDKVNKELVRSCHQLMEEYLIDTCPSADHKHQRAEETPPPPSPVGVLDAAACGSCDIRSENPLRVSGSSEAGQSNKRLRSFG